MFERKNLPSRQAKEQPVLSQFFTGKDTVLTGDFGETRGRPPIDKSRRLVRVTSAAFEWSEIVPEQPCQGIRFGAQKPLKLHKKTRVLVLLYQAKRNPYLIMYRNRQKTDPLDSRHKLRFQKDFANIKKVSGSVRKITRQALS
jgi:hypothetical protein